MDTGLPVGWSTDRLFAEYERKYKKHLVTSSDAQGRLAGQFIPYDELRNRTVLDVACGLGWASVNMASAGADVTAIDLTENGVRFTQAYAQHCGVQVHALQMSAEELKFDSESFDFVLGWGFIMHTANPEAALREMVRVVKPGGAVVLYFYYRDSVTFWWHFFVLRGILSAEFVRYGFSLRGLVSRHTDGTATGGNPNTVVLSRRWFPKSIGALDDVNVSFIGWGRLPCWTTFQFLHFQWGVCCHLPGKCGYLVELALVTSLSSPRPRQVNPADIST